MVESRIVPQLPTRRVHPSMNGSLRGMVVLTLVATLEALHPAASTGMTVLVSSLMARQSASVATTRGPSL